MNIARVAVATGIIGAGATGASYAAERRSGQHPSTYAQITPALAGIVGGSATIGALASTAMKFQEGGVTASMRASLQRSVHANAAVAAVAGVVFLGTLLGSKLGSESHRAA